MEVCLIRICLNIEIVWHYVGGLLSRRSLCFGTKPNKGLGLGISDETRSGRGKAGLREARGAVSKGTQRGSVGEGTQRGAVGKGTQRGQLAKRDAERQSRTGAEGTSQDELAVQCWMVSRRRQWRKTVKNELAFEAASEEFREKYTPSDSLQDARKAVQKNVTKLPFLHLELT